MDGVKYLVASIEAWEKRKKDLLRLVCSRFVLKISLQQTALILLLILEWAHDRWPAIGRLEESPNSAGQGGS